MGSVPDDSSNGYPGAPSPAEALLGLGFRPGRKERRDQAGDLVENYRLGAPLGEGAFGTVWMAEQIEPVRRTVALKLIKRGMDSREVVARFEAESQALAIMDHPNIAAVLDAGTTTDDRPYFAMELVKGEPFTSYCDSRNLSLRERLELFIPVCQAVQHAHQKAILHRDLKPSNILVAEVDGKAVPKVIDFGISKALGAKREWQEGTLMQTLAGAPMGTLQYMSPEQTGSVPDVDTRSDIYSLGAILYELLTGRPPLEPGDSAYDETLRRIRVEEAVKPSALIQPADAFRKIARARDTDPQRLKRALRGDLDWITTKALEKDRRRRYETATALAADLRRHLEQEPVSAAAPSWGYLFAKFARRHKAAFVTAGLVSAALVAGTGMSLWQAAEARAARVSSERNHAEARKNLGKAREAVEKYLTRVADNPQLKESGFHELRKDLLETALPFYEELAGYSGSDPGLLHDKSRALGDLANIHAELGETAKAVHCFRQALEIDEALLGRAPDNAGYRETFGLHCNNCAHMLPPEESVQLMRRGLEVLEGLHREFPDNQEFVEARITAMINLAVAMDQADDGEGSKAVLSEALRAFETISVSAESTPALRVMLAMTQANAGTAFGDLPGGNSETLFRSALSAFEQVCEEIPADYSTRGLQAAAVHRYGLWLTAQGRREEAIAEFRKAERIQREIIALLPEIPGRKYSLVNTLHALGEALIHSGRPLEAGPGFEETLSILTSLREDYPRVAEYTWDTALASARLAALEEAEGDWKHAASLYGQSVACMRELVEQVPGKDSYRTELCLLLTKHAVTSTRAQDGPAAAASALEAAGMAEADREQHENFAALLAAIIPLLRDSEPAKADECAACAVRQLQRAIDAGLLAMERIRDDSRFNPLRRYPAFAGLRPAPPDPAGRVPSRFTFYYMHDDPGIRHWTRTGDRWVERQPSGQQNVYSERGRIRVHGISGTEIRREGEAALKLFIPDIGTSSTPTLLMAVEPDRWSLLGEIKDLE